MCTIGRVKAFGSDECRLSGEDTLSGVSKGLVLLLITVEPHRHLSGLATVIQHQGRRVGLREQQKEDDTRSSPEADKFPLLRRQLWVWTLQMARSQWRKKEQNRLCFGNKCTSPIRQVRVGCKLNHSGPHIHSASHHCRAKYPVCDRLHILLDCRTPRRARADATKQQTHYCFSQEVGEYV